MPTSCLKKHQHIITLITVVVAFTGLVLLGAESTNLRKPSFATVQCNNNRVCEQGAYCGDNICQPEENYDTCQQDCDYPYRENNQGFVYIKDGHFYKDGERIRFLGPSLGTEANKSAINFTINMLPHYGFNAIRPHLYDDAYFVKDLSNPPNTTRVFFDYTKGDDSYLDRFDYLLYLAKENNLHAYMSFDRKDAPILPSDSDICNESECGDKIDWENAVKDLYLSWPYSTTHNSKIKYIWYFDERFKRLHFEFAKNILEHVNQYTELKVKDDPSIAFFEVSNENNAFTWFLGEYGSHLELLPEFFKEELRMKWNNWLKNKYSTTEALSSAWNDNNTATIDLQNYENLSASSIEYKPLLADFGSYSNKRADDIIAFITNLTLGYYKEFEEFVRENGLKIPLLYSNSGNQQQYPPSQYVLTQGDVVSAGAYRLGFNDSYLKYGDRYSPFMWGWLGSVAVANKPHIIYETNVFRPAKYRATYPLMTVMAGALQDWDAIFFHNMYSWTKEQAETGLGKGLLYAGYEGLSIWRGVTYNMDELYLSAMKASRYFTNFLVKPLKDPITLVVGTDSTKKTEKGITWSNLDLDDYKNTAATRFFNNYRVKYSEQSESYFEGPSLQDSDDIEASGEIIGDEFQWDLDNGIFSYDNPRLKMYTGFVGNSFIFDGVSVDNIQSEDGVYSSFVLQSLDNISIDKSDSLSLIMQVGSDNTGVDYNDTSKPGTLPIIVDKPKAIITIGKTDNTLLICEEVGFFKQVLSRKECTYTNGKLIINLENNYPYDGNVSNAVFEVRIYSEVCNNNDICEEGETIENCPKDCRSHLPGDANGDGRVDSEDFALLVEDYLGEPVHNTDFNSDGRVDSEDFAVLQANYLKEAGK